MSADNDMSFEGMELESVIIVDDYGNDHEFMVLETMNIEESTYYVLLPPDEAEDAIILKLVSDENGENSFVDIEDDAEWERVEKAWNEILDEEFGEEEEIED